MFDINKDGQVLIRLLLDKNDDLEQKILNDSSDLDDALQLVDALSGIITKNHPESIKRIVEYCKSNPESKRAKNEHDYLQDQGFIP